MNILLSITEFKLPFTDPILIFSLILVIILLTPLLLNKLRVPHLIGLIIAGAIIGPNGFNLILRDSSFELFGTVGLLYIMFLAGLEMDLNDFKRNSTKSLAFGSLTFVLPFTLGVLTGIYVLDFPLVNSFLIGSMFASHTLISYPIISKFGIAKNLAVNVTVGGTVITDTLALLVLSIVTGMIGGDISSDFWIRLIVSFTIFLFITLFIIPIIGRYFFKKISDNILQYIFVLSVVFFAAILAMNAKIEGIIGAFFAGLALNRLIPKTSPLMNRIEFIGNALFIPFFLIGVGMLINIDALISHPNSIGIAVIITILALLGKYGAAYLTQKMFKFSSDQRGLIFGLSSSRAAATLAIVLIGMQLGLLTEEVLNATVLMILVTCTVSSVTTQNAAQNITKSELTVIEADNSINEEKFLIPVNNPEMATRLTRLSMVLKNSKSKNNLYALNIISNTTEINEVSEKKAQKIIENATDIAASADNQVTGLVRYDIDIPNAITGVVKEHKITDLVLGLHQKKDISDSFLGMVTENLLTKCNHTTVFIYRGFQPLATVKRHLVFIPQNADKEIGFSFWLTKVWNIGLNGKTKMIFYAPAETIPFLKVLQEKYPLYAEFHEFHDWSNFPILANDIKADDNLIFVMSRKNEHSYTPMMEQIPAYLDNFFKHNNFILVYPIQTIEDAESDLGFDRLNPSLDYTRLTNFSKKIQNIFKK
ncbi:cation:proton antiporter [Dysgonomonas sp. 216]|uniref:cation:proton antiporter n=1 Tax=Dysgonomonas sp. 216 TaxID=2302934 RepID=UPI0013D78345|nr:cation:proton antiporter [Dysgonomonas sp. 216]NDW18183.1 cation:proton antiporter [Dysgonomonas sp. 216]